MSQQVLIYGRHAVISTLKNKSRKIIKIMVTKENASELSFVERNKLQIVDRKEIEKQVGKDAVHQGFLLFAEMLKTFSIEDVVDICQANDVFPWGVCCVIDSVCCIRGRDGQSRDLSCKHA